MGTKGAEIVGMDVKELIELLNKALADEWLAYYQYWAGAYVVKGPMRPNVEEEMREHAKEELEHAEMLAERIVQLGGEPVLDLTKWIEIANCKYRPPTDFHVLKILDQNIEAEQCAIETYKKILDKVRGADMITGNTIRKIMQDEVEHEEELQALKEDIEMIK